MTRAAVVTTTINKPKNLLEWAQTMSTEDIIIVVGDHKTPHRAVNNICVQIFNEYGIRAEYFHPDAQTTWHSSVAIGWNCIQRRNIGFLEAARAKPSFIVTIDDDNFPLEPNQMDVYEKLLTETIPSGSVLTKDTGWYNVGEVYHPRIVHRGFPLKHRHQTKQHSAWEKKNINIGVATSLWIGDPDIDAIERIANDPKVYYPDSRSVIFDSSTWCPFNSQATAFHTALMPLYMMWPDVGRFDDIFPGYVVRTVLDQIGYNVHYGDPLVSQMRNEHDLFADLQGEMLGYGRVSELTQLLREFTIPKPASKIHNIVFIANAIYMELKKLPWIPRFTINAFEAWMQDIENLAAYPTSVNFTMKSKED